MPNISTVSTWADKLVLPHEQLESISEQHILLLR